jgi:DNA-binding NarL/FixJ family response regulator
LWQQVDELRHLIDSTREIVASMRRLTEVLQAAVEAELQLAQRRDATRPAPEPQPSENPPAARTDRDRRILALREQGLTTPEIADVVGCTVHIVRNVVKAFRREQGTTLRSTRRRPYLP